MLSNKQITEFQEIYKSAVGKDISREQACKSGMQIIELMRKIIINNKHYDQQEKR